MRLASRVTSMKVKQSCIRLAAAFSLAYLLSGFLHAFIVVVFLVFKSSDIVRVAADVGLFLSFIGSEAIEAPFSGGFLKDADGYRDAATYINLYPLISTTFVIFYVIFEKGWRWLRFTGEG